MTATPMNLSAPSPAKINLTLRIGSVRDDGFHEIESLVALIDFADTVTVVQRDDGEITLRCDLAGIPLDESNLAVRAALALRAAANVRLGAHIDLVKRIPAGGGLGGGSSNAAATLQLLNQLWNLNLSREGLQAIGATLGSDVPLFLLGSPLILARGRGEQIQVVEKSLDAHVVLILPDLHCATPAVYRAFDELVLSRIRPSICDVLNAASPLPSDIAVGQRPLSPEHLSRLLRNDLEPAAIAVCPALGGHLRALRSLLATPVHVTGSGAAMFALFDQASQAAEAQRVIPERTGLRAELARVLPGSGSARAAANACGATEDTRDQEDHRR